MTPHLGRFWDEEDGYAHGGDDDSERDSKEHLILSMELNDFTQVLTQEGFKGDLIPSCVVPTTSELIAVAVHGWHSIVVCDPDGVPAVLKPGRMFRSNLVDAAHDVTPLNEP